MNAKFSGAFSEAIASENARGFTAVIPDIKCLSPKEGDLTSGRNPLEVAKRLVTCGAPVLSVVTEREHFGGSPELLRAVTLATNIPVLRKDFITSEAMLTETVALGAAAVLLICATLDEDTLAILYNKALELGLEPLMEIHTEKELAFAGGLGARLIGVNNRNITALECDGGGVEQTVALAPMTPPGALLISESGISSPDDVKLAASSGANAVLIGTALWQADNVEVAYRSFHIERSGNRCAR